MADDFTPRADSGDDHLSDTGEPLASETGSLDASTIVGQAGETIAGQADETIAGQAGETLIVSRPAPGQSVEIQAAAGQTYVLDFAPGDAQVQVQGNNLILAFDDNGDGTVDSRIVFLDLADVAHAANAPTFQIAGTDIDSGVLFDQAVALGGQDGAPLDDVAAGPAALGGGGTYEDDLGSSIDLLSAQNVIPGTELQFGLIDINDEILLVEATPVGSLPLADSVLTPVSQGDLPPALLDALGVLGLGFSGTSQAGFPTLAADGGEGGGEESDVVFFKQLNVDGAIGDDDSGVVADFGGADGETALGDLVFTLQSNPTFGQLILVTAGGDTSFLTVGDTFTSADTVWWIATQGQISDFLSGEGAPEFLPNVDFTYSVTDADGNSASAPVTITFPGPEAPEAFVAIQEGDCLNEDTTGTLLFSADPTDGASKISQIVISDFPTGGPDDAWVVDAGSVNLFGLTPGVDFTVSYDAATGTLIITLVTTSLSVGQTVEGTVNVTPNPDSDVDANLHITATAINGAGSATGGSDSTIVVDADADGIYGSSGDDGDGIDLSVTVTVADDAGDAGSSFHTGETGTITVSATFDDFQDGSETHTVTVTAPPGFAIGNVVGDLPAGVSVVSNIDGTLVLSVDSHDGDGQDGVGSFSATFEVTNVSAVDGVAVFDAEARAVETNTLAPDVECDPSDADNIAVATDDALTTVANVTPPAVALSLPDQVDCIQEDSGTDDPANVVTLTVTPTGDEQITQIVITGLQPDWDYDLTGLATDGATLTDSDFTDGSITISVPNLTSYTGTFAVQPPADSDLDHPTLTANATVVDPIDPTLTASADGTLDIVVDADADGMYGSSGDDDDGIDLSVSITVADNAGDPDSVFQTGETGTVTVSATFDDFKDGSETHTVTVTAPTGFTIGNAVGSLPAGVSVVSNSGTTLVLSVDSQDGDGQDGVGSFSATFEVTNVSAVDGVAEFDVEARAVETNTLAPDVECDPSDVDNIAVATDDASATVANVAPPAVALSLPDQGDCVLEDSGTDDPGNVVTLTVTPTGDDQITQIVITGFQSGWDYDLTGLATDGATLTDSDFSDGSITILVPNLTSYTGTFAVQPPADSDIDHPTITATATVVDPTDPSLTTSADGTLDIIVDAVADPVTVDVIVNDGDSSGTFEPNETGTVQVNATFGDVDDESENHIVTVVIPAAFAIGALVGLPDGVEASTVDLGGGEHQITFTVGSGVSSFDYSFEVTAPDGVTGDDSFYFQATATATETNTPDTHPGDLECAEANNTAEATANQTVQGSVGDVTPVLIVGENNSDDGVDDEANPHRVHSSDSDNFGPIVGENGADVLIGDVGGGALDGKTMNLVLVLDTSNSMEEQIEFNGVTMTRIEALDKAVESLLDKLTGTAGLTVRLHMVSFNNDVTGEDTFDIITNGVVNAAALQDAKDFILDADDVASTVAQGNTNYEAGFQAAVDWFSDDAKTLDDPDFNKTIFVSDGLPNRSYRGNGTTEVTSQGNAQTSLNHVLGQQPAVGTFPADTVSEYAALLGEFKGMHGTVDAIGINVGADGIAVLSQVDGDDADSIDKGEQLADALGGLSQATQLADVGNDVITGNGGNDLIFGDAIYTDSLATDQGLTMAPGSGWEVIQHLVNNTDFFEQDVGKSVNEEIMDFLRDPANMATYEFGRESVNTDGVGREGGDDTIDGGGGDDLIFGQEGNDLITGGSGDDIIVGGTGNDTMDGGADSDRFVWTDQFNAGEIDTINGFDSTSGGDALDLSALLQGEDSTGGGGALTDYLNVTSNGTDTTIAIDANGDGAGGTDVSIVLHGVDLTGGSVDQVAIIQSLLDSGNVVTD